MEIYKNMENEQNMQSELQQSTATENSQQNFNATEADNSKKYTESEIHQQLIKEKKKGRWQGALICFSVIAIIFASALSVKMMYNSALSLVYPEKTLIEGDNEKKLNQLYGMINKYFLWDIDTTAAVDGVYKGLLESLDDPYSCYYTKEEMDGIAESSSGHYSGIGAYVTQDIESNITYISRPMPNSPAEESGLLPNDYIYEIDGEDVTGLELNVVVSKIKGPENTDVVISVKREGVDGLLDITVKRKTIEVDMLEYSMLEDGIGYIWLYEFEKVSVQQFDKAYADLESQGMKGLIVDLRDNPGGDLAAVVDLCDEFLPEGTIVYTKDKNGKGDKYTSDADYKNIPLVLLVNGNSASASEIFTGALKDYGVATIVGTKTFGKGIVQSLFSLTDGTGVKITESEYYLPNDECIHGVGIEPDIEVEFDAENYVKDKNDNQKDKAIEVLKEKMK